MAENEKPTIIEYQNRIMPVYPKETVAQSIVSLQTNDYFIGKDSAVHIPISSSGAIAILQGEEIWGAYNGVFLKREHVYEEGELSLEEFLESWNKISPVTLHAFLFGASPADEIELEEYGEEFQDNTSQYREEVVGLIADILGIENEAFHLGWNDYTEGETEVALDPYVPSISVNYQYYDETTQ